MYLLAHNRALIGLLLVLLQVGLFPDRGPLGCMARSASLECCCVAHQTPPERAPAPAAEARCCAERGATAPTEDAAARVRDGAAACSCSAGLQPPPPTMLAGEDETHDGEASYSLAGQRPGFDGLRTAQGRRLAARTTPRAGTGPPRHLLLQVFLI